jgi:hypothetical protein
MFLAHFLKKSVVKKDKFIHIFIRLIYKNKFIQMNHINLNVFGLAFFEKARKSHLKKQKLKIENLYFISDIKKTHNTTYKAENLLISPPLFSFSFFFILKKNVFCA